MCRNIKTLHNFEPPANEGRGPRCCAAVRAQGERLDEAVEGQRSSLRARRGRDRPRDAPPARGARDDGVPARSRGRGRPRSRSGREAVRPRCLGADDASQRPRVPVGAGSGLGRRCRYRFSWEDGASRCWRWLRSRCSFRQRSSASRPTPTARPCRSEALFSRSVRSRCSAGLAHGVCFSFQWQHVSPAHSGSGLRPSWDSCPPCRTRAVLPLGRCSRPAWSSTAHSSGGPSVSTGSRSGVPISSSRSASPRLRPHCLSRCSSTTAASARCSDTPSRSSGSRSSASSSHVICIVAPPTRSCCSAMLRCGPRRRRRGVPRAACPRAARRACREETHTEDHTRRVALRAAQVGDELGLSPGRLRDLAIGGLLHDIGKLAVPAEILRKPGPLTDAEYQRRDAARPYGAGAAPRSSEASRRWCFASSAATTSASTDPAIRAPSQATRSRSTSRILAVCDVYDALISERVYRRGVVARARTRAPAGRSRASCSTRTASRRSPTCSRASAAPISPSRSKPLTARRGAIRRARRPRRRRRRAPTSACGASSRRRSTGPDAPRRHVPARASRTRRVTSSSIQE